MKKDCWSKASLAHRLALAAVVMTVSWQNSYAASTASVTATANAAVVASITNSETTQLNFGSVAAGDGSRVVDPAAAPSWSGAFRGKYHVTGNSALTYQVSAIAGFNLTSGVNTMAVGSFKTTCNGHAVGVDVSAAAMTACSLAAAGADDVYVGATLTIGAAQATGVYAGTYTFTVTYE